MRLLQSPRSSPSPPPPNSGRCRFCCFWFNVKCFGGGLFRVSTLPLPPTVTVPEFMRGKALLTGRETLAAATAASSSLFPLFYAPFYEPFNFGRKPRKRCPSQPFPTLLPSFPHFRPSFAPARFFATFFGVRKREKRGFGRCAEGFRFP